MLNPPHVKSVHELMKDMTSILEEMADRITALEEYLGVEYHDKGYYQNIKETKHDA